MHRGVPLRAALFLGTSGAMRVVYATEDPPVIEGGWCYRLDERRVVAGGALSNGGNVLWSADPSFAAFTTSQTGLAGGGSNAQVLRAYSYAFTTGAGGSVGFADRRGRVGFGYVMNQMGLSLGTDQRVRNLTEALYSALGEG